MAEEATATSKSEAGVTSRCLSAPLLLGMLMVPTLFVWFFLRRGYAPSLRRAAFIYAGTLLLVGVLGSVGR